MSSSQKSGSNALRQLKERLWRDKRKAFTSKLDQMRREANLTDCVLVCGDRRFPVHKSILMANSDYFDAMFDCSGMRESLTGEVDLGAYSANAVERVIDYMYGETVADSCSLDELEELIPVCQMMLIEPLFNFCMQRVGALLTGSTCIRVWRISKLYDHDDDAELKTRVVRIINYQTEFWNLCCDELKDVCRDLSLKADCTLETILAWVRSEAEGRRDRLPELLDEFVDLDRVDSVHLGSLMIDESLMRTNRPLLKKLTKVAFSRITAARVTADGVGQPSVRSAAAGDDQILLLFSRNYDVGKRARDSKHIMRVFNVGERRWSPSVKRLPFDLVSGMAAVEHEGHVYFLGGRDSEMTITKYSPVANTSSQVGELRVGFNGDAGAGVHNGLIYVVGGGNGDGGSKQVQRFDPQTRECVEVAPTNDLLCGPFVFEAADGLLYAIGTLCDPGEQSLEQYDDAADRWTVVTRVPSEMESDCVLCALHRGDLVVSCEETCNFVYKYDFVGKEWSSLTFGDQRFSLVSGLWSVRSGSGEETLVSRDFYEFRVLNVGRDCVGEDEEATWERVWSPCHELIFIEDLCLVVVLANSFPEEPIAEMLAASVND